MRALWLQLLKLDALFIFGGAFFNNIYTENKSVESELIGLQVASCHISTIVQTQQKSSECDHIDLIGKVFSVS